MLGTSSKVIEHVSSTCMICIVLSLSITNKRMCKDRSIELRGRGAKLLLYGPSLFWSRGFRKKVSVTSSLSFLTLSIVRLYYYLFCKAPSI